MSNLTQTQMPTSETLMSAKDQKAVTVSKFVQGPVSFETLSSLRKKVGAPKSANVSVGASAYLGSKSVYTKISFVWEEPLNV